MTDLKDIPIKRFLKTVGACSTYGLEKYGRSWLSLYKELPDVANYGDIIPGTNCSTGSIIYFLQNLGIDLYSKALLGPKMPWPKLKQKLEKVYEAHGQALREVKRIEKEAKKEVASMKKTLRKIRKDLEKAYEPTVHVEEDKVDDFMWDVKSELGMDFL